MALLATLAALAALTILAALERLAVVAAKAILVALAAQVILAIHIGGLHGWPNIIPSDTKALDKQISWRILIPGSTKPLAERKLVDVIIADASVYVKIRCCIV